MKKRKLYYCEDEGEFYWVRETLKNFFIEWVENRNFGDLLDQNVRWKELKVSKVGKGEHYLECYDEDDIVVYPFQIGTAFCLVPATAKHIDDKIIDCAKWGVSSDYYKNLLNYVSGGK